MGLGDHPTCEELLEEVHRLRRENEALVRENEVLRRELGQRGESLHRPAPSAPPAPQTRMPDQEERVRRKHEEELEAVKRRLSAGMDVNRLRTYNRPLGEAIEAGNTLLAEFLLQNGADVGLGCRSMPPLILALKNQQYEIARMIVEHGADVNAMPENSVVHPLIDAVLENDLRALTFLLENGADTTATFCGLTPLETAIEEGNVVAADILRRFT
eukprot:Sspe_Gene.100105::Locus_74786_Transcript_2_2_Confidence_0.750_Length_950::g.100105::m.100105